MPLEPTTPEEMAEAVRAHGRVLAVAARTKPRLSAGGEDVTFLSTRGLSGITEYDASEFTFTALAGTPVRTIATALAVQGQYLPFDPLLLDAGATLGGTVAAGLNGPGRLRYGGIRDFILAVQFVDGRGVLMRGGAKVVKNAAGFDLPKFFVGSLGRYGVLTELTFKVFPRPASWLTWKLPVSPSQLTERIAACASGRWELDALEYDGVSGQLYARIGGPAVANAALSRELQATFPGGAVLEQNEADAFWESLTEFSWAGDCAVLVKVPTTLKVLDPLFARVSATAGTRVVISGAGSVGWIGLPDAEAAMKLHATLRALHLSALVIRGGNAPLFLGAATGNPLQAAVHRVFDPAGRFAPLPEATA